jgi:hypothetical protein
MMPMGYEYGCRAPLDGRLAPGDWAWRRQSRGSIFGFHRRGQPMKAATPALNVSKVTAPHSPVAGCSSGR